MSKRTLGLIIFLIAVTGLLLYLAVAPKTSAPLLTPPPASPPRVSPTPVPSAILLLSPNPLTISSLSGSLEVKLDAKDEKVTGVQLELSFEPKVITKITVQAATFFTNPVILINDVNYKTGRISYALAIAPAAEAQGGKGVLATIEFTAQAGTAQTTQINLLPKTLVTARGVASSVLKETSGATINFATTTPQTTIVPPPAQ